MLASDVLHNFFFGFLRNRDCVGCGRIEELSAFFHSIDSREL